MEMLEEDGKHHQNNQLDWDDTPLTITVNPMQSWVDEDEEQGIEYLMGKGGKRPAGMSKLGGPTLHMSGAGHLVENDEDLDTSDSEDDEDDDEEESDQDLDSDEEEDDDSGDSGSEEDLDVQECIEAGRYSSRGVGGSHHSGLSSSSGVNTSGVCSKKGKRGNRTGGAAEEQLEWDSTI